MENKHTEIAEIRYERLQNSKFHPRRFFRPARCFKGAACRAFSDAIPNVQKYENLIGFENCWKMTV